MVPRADSLFMSPTARKVGGAGEGRGVHDGTRAGLECRAARLWQESHRRRGRPSSSSPILSLQCAIGSCARAWAEDSAWLCDAPTLQSLIFAPCFRRKREHPVHLKAQISPAKAVCSSAAVNLLKDKKSWHTVCHHALESKPAIIRTPRCLQGNDLSSPDASDRVYAVEPRKQPKNKQSKLDARTSESQVGGPLPSPPPLASEWQSNDGVMGRRCSVWDNTPSLASTARSSPDPVNRSALRNRFGRRKSCPRVPTKSATASSVPTPQTLSGRFYLGRVPNDRGPVRKPHVAAGLPYRGCHAQTRKSHLNWAWGRIGSGASQIGLVITTSDVTYAIGGSVEHCSEIPCHSML